MKKFLLAFIAFFLIAGMFVLFGSLGDKDKISAFGENTKSKNVIYIGVYEPLTDDYAQGGMCEALGIRYANRICPTVEINGETFSVELIEADNAADEKGSAFAAQTLIESNVSAVLGSYSSKATAAGLPEFDQKGIPMIGISCTSQSATANGGNYFRICYTDSFQSGIMANFAYGIDLRHAAVITQIGDEDSKVAGKTFADAFIQLGGEVTEFAFQLGQENFRALTKELLNSDIDFVYMLSGASEAEYFVKQSRSESLTCPILGPESWDSALLLNELSSNFRQIYFASEFNSDASADPASAEFAENFSSWLSNKDERIAENGGNNYTSSLSAMAYDSYMLLIQAIETANSKDPQVLSQTLKTLSYQGITGNISFDEKGELLKQQAYIKTINTITKNFELIQTNTVGN
ncbi:MAG: ABC transporter substrate-binding protein [Oscillospiraceae bacterium]|nr:ABC transporter substrate-binding protein [Oscillospiraceae bacterium]